jgi:hypothetical protein
LTAELQALGIIRGATDRAGQSGEEYMIGIPTQLHILNEENDDLCNAQEVERNG